MKDQVLDNLSAFSRSSLKEAKTMAFLNRFDTKFVLKNNMVFHFLEKIQKDYSVLDISGTVIQSYNTVYFDTPDLLCFNMHHNKRMNRFKFRTRKYLSNGKTFNEIKRKLNTGKTVKFRQRRDGLEGIVSKAGVEALPPLRDLSDYDEHFESLVRQNGYGFVGELIPSLHVYFNRVTFLNKHFPERMTLDFGLGYGYNGMDLMLPNTAIVELKREKGPQRTLSQNFFRGICKEPSGFSKYTIGISLTHAEAKKNRFLPRIRHLEVGRIKESEFERNVACPQEAVTAG
ncbi:MAG: polyphosphate polymerase domain-containing protein [Chitinispirillales bacterium]|jgi:hypothetical protein|nr:polyphosphate polymerase domain-containing protein [Chitinispirillales bacterium]